MNGELTRKRLRFLDILRVICACLVVVNHTNSTLFQSTDPSCADWWLSVVWYYVSKAAVPVFVMISGACLLGRRDGVKKALKRAGRMALVLLLFGWLYFAHDAWVNWGLWPRVLRLDLVVSQLWNLQLADSFWYLWLYMGLMLALPLLQTLSVSLSRREQGVFAGLCFLFDAAWPLLSHYVPGLALPQWCYLPLFSGYLGLFFAGYLLKEPAKKPKTAVSVAVFVGGIALCVLLTRLEVSRAGLNSRYWFMDDRMHPALLVCLAAMALFTLTRDLFPGESGYFCRESGGCAFGVYLLQEWVIAQTSVRIWQRYLQTGLRFTGMLVWETVVILICFAGAWIMRRIPGLKKLL